MADVQLKIDDTGIRDVLAGLPGQWRFALALALTWSAQSIQRHVIARLGDSLHIRTDWLTNPKRPGGYRVVPARKTDEAPRAEVLTYSRFMDQLETGGQRERGKNPMAIPLTSDRGAVRPIRGDDSMGTTTVQLWPRNLLRRKMRDKGSFFTIRGTIYQRTGPGKLGESDSVFPIYVMRDTATLRPIWPFKRLVQEELARVWLDTSYRAAERALATARTV